MSIFKKSFWQTKDSYSDRVIYNPVKVGIGLFLGLLILIILIANFPFGTVGAGERGVRLRFQAVTGDVVDEGLYFQIPFVERVVKMDIKTQKEEVGASAASKDLQTVNSTIALNYSLQPDSVAKIYQEIGRDYKVRVIDPAIQESVKASTAKFTAEELITKREEVSQDIKTHLAEKLTDTGIIVESFSIINFDFSKSFNDAIEAKVTAEQDALAAKNKLEQIKYEKEQAIVSAEGRATALRIEQAALSDNPDVLKLRWIEKWDGHQPQVISNATPLINI